MNLLILIMILLLSKFISVFTCIYTQSLIFSIAMSIQQLIIFAIPIYIFLSIYTSVYRFPAAKKYFAFTLLQAVLISGAITFFIFSNISKYLLIQNSHINIQTIKSLTILFQLPISNICSNYLMILVGIFAGILMQYLVSISNNNLNHNLNHSMPHHSKQNSSYQPYHNSSHHPHHPILFYINSTLQNSFQYMEYFMKHYLTFFIYIMLVGIFLNIIYSQILTIIISNYYHIIPIIIGGFIGLGAIYTLIIYKINNYTNQPYSITEIWKNIISPLSIGSPAMSSGLAIPSNIEATKKNTKDSLYSNFIIPIITNIHTVGDNIILSVANIFTLSIFGFESPNLYLIAQFAIYGAIYKLSSAGVPGAGVLVIHGLLVYLFNYTPEMLAIITSSYVLLDILATAGNIMFNNLLAVILHAFYTKK